MVNKKKQTMKVLPGLSKRIAYVESIVERGVGRHPLRHGAKKYRSVISNVPDVIWTADKERHIVFISKNVKALSGYTSEEEYEMARETTWFERMHLDDVESVKEAFKALVEKRKPYNVEYRFRRRDGSWIWLHDRAVVTYEEEGNIYADGIMSDITERKQAEVEGRRLKEKYESLIKNLPCAVDVCLPDETATMLFISDRHTEWTGYFPEDFYKEPGLWPKTVHPEDRPGAVQAWIEACENKVEYTYEYRVVHKDTGQMRWIRDHGVPVEDKSGNIIAYEETQTDITEQKGVEEALRESEEFTSSLLRCSPDPIVVINPDLSIRYVNPALTRMTGFSEAELLGTKPPYPWWTEESFKRNLEKLQKGASVGTNGMEDLYQKRNGKQFWVDVTITPVMRNGMFKYLLVGWADITEQKRLREDMQHYITEITMAQEQERRRISRELHDETVQSLADLCTDVDVIRMKQKLPVNLCHQLDQLRAKVGSILKEVRRFSHELRPGLLDHFGLIPSLELLAEELRAEGKVDCQVQVVGCEQRLSPEAEVMLFRISQEGLRNTRKHSNAKKATVRVEFNQSRVKLDIIDDGNGFELPEGLGGFARQGKLGLMGMKERAHLLGGSFKIQSKLGKGTSVTVKIPLHTTA